MDAEDPPAESAVPAAVTIYDHQPDPEAKVDFRRLPAVARRGVRILWDAAPADFVLSVALQAVGGLGIAVQLLLGQRALAALLAASREGGSLGDVLPWAVAVAVVAAALFFASAVQRERQQLLGELVSRHVQGTILDVATAVGLEAAGQGQHRARPARGHRRPGRHPRGRAPGRRRRLRACPARRVRDDAGP
jgi:ATP-binding cassette subfamily B protein